VAIENLTPSQQEMKERAEEARGALAGRLMGRLGEAMQSGGVTEAVSVCAVDAPRIAAEVGQEFGLSIGRTSFRLRNPDNAVPAWGQSAVERRVQQPVYLVGEGGELGVLTPIRVSKRCLGCHGDPEGIDPAVREALAEHYPDDEAVGFAEGDLRGWFWTLVPAE
jgi:hypothetical protein